MYIYIYIYILDIYTNILGVSIYLSILSYRFIFLNYLVLNTEWPHTLLSPSLYFHNLSPIFLETFARFNSAKFLAVYPFIPTFLDTEDRAGSADSLLSLVNSLFTPTILSKMIMAPLKLKFLHTSFSFLYLYHQEHASKVLLTKRKNSKIPPTTQLYIRVSHLSIQLTDLIKDVTSCTEVCTTITQSQAGDMEASEQFVFLQQSHWLWYIHCLNNRRCYGEEIFQPYYY